jgi:hypothetical protein
LPEGDTGVSQHTGGASSLFGDLVGGVEVSIQPNGMILLQHVAQSGSDTHGHNDGGTGAQTDDLHVRNGAQLGNDVLQRLVGDHQAVAAGQQHVTHLGMSGDVLDALVDLSQGDLAVMLTGETAAGAVTAVHGALVSDQQQDAVGITVGQAGTRRVGVLMQGVGILVIGELQLVAGGDRLLTDGIVGIVQIDQGQIVRGDSHAQLAQRGGNALFLFGSQLDVLFQLIQRLDPVFDLPMPIVPFSAGTSRNRPFSLLFLI